MQENNRRVMHAVSGDESQRPRRIRKVSIGFSQSDNRCHTETSTHLALYAAHGLLTIARLHMMLSVVSEQRTPGMTDLSEEKVPSPALSAAFQRNSIHLHSSIAFVSC